MIERLKDWLRISTRYEKTPLNYLALIKLAAFRLWCEFKEPAT